MDKKYQYSQQNQEAPVVQETDVVYGYNISQLDALWTLIVNQSVEVQHALAERLNRIIDKSGLHQEPYSIQELHNRINESQHQIECGETSTMREVDNEVEQLFTSWK